MYFTASANKLATCFALIDIVLCSDGDPGTRATACGLCSNVINEQLRDTRCRYVFLATKSSFKQLLLHHVARCYFRYEKLLMIGTDYILFYYCCSDTETAYSILGEALTFVNNQCDSREITPGFRYFLSNLNSHQCGGGE